MKQGWKIKELSEIVEFQRGLTYSKKDEVNFSENVVLRSNNVDLAKNKLDLRELKYINSKIEISESKRVKKGSLIICTANGSKSHLGKVALIDDNYDYAFGGFMGLITPREQVNSKFLFYSLTSDRYRKFISELSAGANINNLKFGDLGLFKVPTPSVHEQKRIVAILDETFAAIDKAKANAEQNLKNTKELFESYLNEVFEKKGKDWEEKKLREIGRTQTGTTPKTTEKENYGNDIPFIKPADVDYKGTGDIRYDNDGLSEIGLKKGRIIESGSTLMVCIGATIGKVGYTEREVSSNQQINSLTPTNEFESKFIYYALTSRSFLDKILLEGKGSQATLPIINKSKWENLSISYPKSKNEQKLLVKKFDDLQAETEKLKIAYLQKINCLEEFKKSILQKAFAGELKTNKVEEFA